MSDRYSSPILQAGTVLGRYELSAHIAEGAFGRVYAARDQKLGIQVAVKVLHPKVLTAPGAVERFRAEARVLAQLNHPHIVRLWDFDDAGPHPYLAMEYVSGTDLAALVAERGRLPPERALRFVIQVVDALGAAFRLGVVHRDLKPANLLLTPQEVVKVADLGLAVVVRDIRDRALRDGQPAALGRGTAAYVAPEQATLDPAADHRADMYSLGVTFFQLLTAQLPFAARTPLEMVMCHLRDPAPAAAEIVPEVPTDLSRLVRRLMAKEPDDRFRDYDSLRDELIGLEVQFSAPRPPGTEAAETNKRSIWRWLRRRG